MKLTKAHWIGIVFCLLLLVADFIFFLQERLFFFVFGIAVLILIIPFLAIYLVESNKEKEKNDRFLEFTRNLAESVKAGTPIGKSILNLRNKDFGSLSPHIEKLSNQISLGIPITKAFETLSLEVDSETIKRAITLIREAENAGGEIDFILESVARSIYEVEKLKKERKAAISNLVVQGYVIFLIFIGIMIVMQFKILPLTEGIGSFSSISTTNFEQTTASASVLSAEKLTRPLLYLLIVQGLFTGLIIGKLAEGSIKAGIKHSIILAMIAFLVSTGATAFLN